VTAEIEREVQASGLSNEEPEPFRPRSFADGVAEALAVVMLVLVTVLLLANALGRYLLSAPLPWAEEVATSLVVWLSMLGMFITARRREIIRVRSFMQKLSHRTQDALDVVTDLISVVALAYLAWFAFSYLLTFGGDATPLLGTPRGLFTSAIPIGSVGLGLVVLIDLVRRLRGMKS
jgi:TRAP-type C4-dicarboxylate transport system permease small subunit